MSDAKFTPGPWSVEWDDDATDTTIPEYWVFIIGVSDANDELIFEFGGEVRSEDARLVATAPEMYTALLEAASFLDLVDASDKLEKRAAELQGEIYKLLDKATGVDDG